MHNKPAVSGKLMLLAFLALLPALLVAETGSIHVYIFDTVGPVDSARVQIRHALNPAVADSGYSDASGVVVFSDVPTAINDAGLMPTQYALRQNYPNPFNPATTIEYDLKKQSGIKFSIYNTIGQKVCTLLDGSMSAGSHALKWDGVNNTGRQVSAGIYFAVMQTEDGYRKVVKMLKVDGSAPLVTKYNVSRIASVNDAVADDYIITISKEGYKTKIDTVEVASSQNTELEYRLDKQNNPPTASFSTNLNKATVGDTITFYNNSTDIDGNLAKLIFDYGDGKSDTTGVVDSLKHVYSSKGKYNVTLTAIDSTGLSDDYSSDIDIQGLLSFQLNAVDLHKNGIDSLFATLTDTTSGKMYHAVTDSSGKAYFNVKEGNYKLDVFDETEVFNGSNYSAIGDWYDYTNNVDVKNDTTYPVMMMPEIIDTTGTNEAEIFDGFNLGAYRTINDTDLIYQIIARWPGVENGEKIKIYLNEDNAKEFLNDDLDPNVTASDLYMDLGRQAMQNVNPDLFKEINKDDLGNYEMLGDFIVGAIKFDYSTNRNQTVLRFDGEGNILMGIVYVNNSFENGPEYVKRFYEHELQRTQGMLGEIDEQQYEQILNMQSLARVNISPMEKNWSLFHNNTYDKNIIKNIKMD